MVKQSVFAAEGEKENHFAGATSRKMHGTRACCSHDQFLETAALPTSTVYSVYSNLVLSKLN